MFTSESLAILDTYIEDYQGYFLGRFFDTGIWSEDIIRRSYEAEAIQLYDAMYDHILGSMSRDLIGYEVNKDNIRTTATFLEKRIIFIEYREDEGKQIRYILNLKIVHR